MQTCLKNLSLLKELLRKLSNLSFSSSKFWRKKVKSSKKMAVANFETWM